VTEAFREIPGRPGLLIVVDHASNAVPADIELGVAPDVLERHVAWDIGAAAVGEALCAAFACPGLFGTVSRLVIDLHREEDSPALIPAASDGHEIPGNVAADREARLARFFRPYHARLGALVVATAPRLIVAVHSFTPRLETRDAPARPWQVGILYNSDDRAARIAIPALAAEGLTVGDNEPYSGRLLNATMNRHAEAHGIPYLAVEIRQDLIAEPAGVGEWAARIARVIERCRQGLG
jgi:predicted N-formylglutamate amidohydrolase